MSGASVLGGTAATGVGLVQGAAALPAVGSAAAGAYTTAGQRIGAALEASKYGKPIAGILNWIARLTEGYIVPASPLPASIPGTIGSSINRIIDEYSKTKNQRR